MYVCEALCVKQSWLYREAALAPYHRPSVSTVPSSNTLSFLSFSLSHRYVSRAFVSANSNPVVSKEAAQAQLWDAVQAADVR